MIRIRMLPWIAMIAGSAVAAPISLTAPSGGATLRGGSLEVLAWSAEGPLPPMTEEWEAFLSIDGGAHYAFRVTPHLDVARRRILWLVPNVDTGDARLLLRIGDERRERSFELPGTYTISRDPRAALPTISPQLFARGEPAREGEEGVLGRAEGDRGATRIIQVISVDRPADIQPAHVIHQTRYASADAPKRSFALTRPATAWGLSIAAREPIAFAAMPLLNAAILLLFHRWNI
jgi:hypothetical protein